MHENSLSRVESFVNHYLARRARAAAAPIRVIDLGSLEGAGNYRPLFSGMNISYVGVDVVPGPNVDLVLANADSWDEISAASVDVVVCGQFMKHCRHPWKVFEEVRRVLKIEGLGCFVAQSAGDIYKGGGEFDGYRFLTDGMLALAEWATLTVLEMHHDKNQWADVTLIVRNDKAAECTG